VFPRPSGNTRTTVKKEVSRKAQEIPSVRSSSSVESNSGSSVRK